MHSLTLNEKPHYIGEHWQSSQGPMVNKYSPTVGGVQASFASADPSTVQQAVACAHKALPGWAALSFDERAAIALRYAQILNASIEDVAYCIAEDTGKPLWECRTEVSAMAGKIAISIEAYQRRTGSTQTTLADNSYAALSHHPHGVMAILGPYNFPGHLPNGHIVPAILAGNTVVFKPSELTPFTGEKMLQLWHESGLPSGVINMVQGDKTTAIALLQQQIDGVLFTGSAATGQLIHKQLAGRPEILLALELGGNNPLIVDDDYQDEQAVLFTLIQSSFISAGQRCTCARRVMIANTAKGDQLVERLVSAAAALRSGAFDADPQPFMGPVISVAAADSIIAAQDSLQAQGGRVLLAAKRGDSSTGFVSAGIIDVTSIASPPDQEYFGPLMQLYRYDRFEQALDWANQTRFGLAAGLISHNRETFERFRRSVRAGIVNWNKPLTGASSSAPFGGVGISGNHRPSAYYAADYCAYPSASLYADQPACPASLPPGMELY